MLYAETIIKMYELLMFEKQLQRTKRRHFFMKFGRYLDVVDQIGRFWIRLVLEAL
jgi:hypothetical protein